MLAPWLPFGALFHFSFDKREDCKEVLTLERAPRQYPANHPSV
jgi:hypothetical protein